MDAQDIAAVGRVRRAARALSRGVATVRPSARLALRTEPAGERPGQGAVPGGMGATKNMKRIRVRRARGAWAFAALASLSVAGCHPNYFGAAMVDFDGENQLDSLRELNATALARSEGRIKLDGVVPFDEVEAFDDDAKSWSNMFSMMDGDGVCA